MKYVIAVLTTFMVMWFVIFMVLSVASTPKEALGFTGGGSSAEVSSNFRGKLISETAWITQHIPTGACWITNTQFSRTGYAVGVGMGLAEAPKEVCAYEFGD